MLKRDQKLAIYMEGELVGDFAKMCYGILRYSPNPVVAIIDSKYAGQDVKDVVQSPRSAPIVSSVSQALELGADVFVLGVATVGGHVPAEWYPAINEAVAKGMCVLNGLHDRLATQYPQLKPGQWIWDVRIEPEGLGSGTGLAAGLNNTRVLMIGTDMAIGKMTAGLEIYRAARQKGINAEFIATGQIGITITGKGVPLDAVRVDYASSAIEREVMGVKDAELIIVEGQGALIHPGSTSNLPLLRGACPTHLVLCHRAGQTHLRRLQHIQIPPLREYCNLYENLGEACGVYPRPKTVAIALNTSALSESDAVAAMKKIEDESGLPTHDPVRFGTEPFLEYLTTRGY